MFPSSSLLLSSHCFLLLSSPPLTSPPSISQCAGFEPWAFGPVVNVIKSFCRLQRPHRGKYQRTMPAFATRPSQPLLLPASASPHVLTRLILRPSRRAVDLAHVRRCVAGRARAVGERDGLPQRPLAHSRYGARAAELRRALPGQSHAAAPQTPLLASMPLQGPVPFSAAIELASSGNDVVVKLMGLPPNVGFCVGQPGWQSVSLRVVSLPSSAAEDAGAASSPSPPARGSPIVSSTPLPCETPVLQLPTIDRGLESTKIHHKHYGDDGVWRLHFALASPVDFGALR